MGAFHFIIKYDITRLKCIILGAMMFGLNLTTAKSTRRGRSGGCDEGEYLNGQQGECMKCTGCPPGHGVTQQCSFSHDTICSPCHLGITWSYTLDDIDRKCIRCRSCENRNVRRECNATSNSLCGPCLTGFYEDSWDGKCKSCMSCAREDRRRCMRYGEECRPDLHREVMTPMVGYQTSNTHTHHQHKPVKQFRHLLGVMRGDDAQNERQLYVVMGLCVALLALVCTLSVGMVYTVMYIRRHVNHQRPLVPLISQEN